MARRLAVSVGFGGNPEQNKAIIERVKVAEEVGVETVFTAETWGRDQFSLLTQLALATSKINIGTGIAPVYGRSPAVLAMTAATLDELSGGRVVLGLGTSGARVIEHWHGIKFSKPIQRTKEYVEIINLIVSGEKVFYDGEIFKLQRGFKLLFEPVRNHIPIYVASISPKSMHSLAGVADGWMPIYWPKSKFAEGKAAVSKAAQDAGRPSDAVECVASLTVVLNPNMEEAKVQAAGPISWYVTNMGDFYHEMLTRNGFGEEVAAMRKVAEEHKPRPFGTNPELMAAMGDRMLDETAIYGDLETVAAGIEERRQLGVDLPSISMPQGDLKQIEQVLGTLVS
ncbi:MAG TPA: LLM class flavin-dependent oxidoreductase [Tepidiformaceae bacterium]|nr:LLM class flavin-dependent oxidoreductase [Tepidiformaceae bacterium]